MAEQDLDKILKMGSKAKIKMYHSMLAKVSSGEILSASQLKTLDTLREEIQEISEEEKKANKDIFILSTKNTARFFNVTPRAVQHWSKAGCPCMGRGSWDLRAVHAWWLENIWFDRAVSNAGDESTNEAKRLYWWQKAAGEEIKNEQLRKDLIAWADIGVIWSSRVAAVTSGLEAFAHRLPPILVGKSRVEMQRIIKKEVRVLRDAYARKGTYCPQVDKPKQKATDG